LTGKPGSKEKYKGHQIFKMIETPNIITESAKNTVRNTSLLRQGFFANIHHGLTVDINI
jgi:hypothetical protein